MLSLELFFRESLLALKRIVATAKGDVTLDDVKNEAWMLAAELEQKGKPLDLHQAEDRDALVGKLYGRMIKPLRTRIGFALRLDMGWDDESTDGVRLADSIRAPDSADPLKCLEAMQLPTPLERACQESYSQATAYAICLYRWPDELSLAQYLCVTRDTLRGRIGRCHFMVMMQPSLFDRVERISTDFSPQRGRVCVVLALPVVSVEQREWAF